MSYVSARSVELEENLLDPLHREYEQSAYVRVSDWIASLNQAPLYPKGTVTMSRTGSTAEEATENLKRAVLEQGWDWSES